MLRLRVVSEEVDGVSNMTKKGDRMTHQQDHKSIEDLIVSNAVQFDTLFRILVGKGIFTEIEFNEKLEEVQAYYQRFNSDLHEKSEN